MTGKESYTAEDTAYPRFDSVGPSSYLLSDLSTHAVAEAPFRPLGVEDDLLGKFLGQQEGCVMAIVCAYNKFIVTGRNNFRVKAWRKGSARLA